MLQATWIGDGLAGTVELLRPAIRSGGRILVGEPYWLEPLSPEGVAAYGLALDGLAADEYASLDGTLDRLGAAGLELLEMVLANPDSWDRYDAS